MTAEFVVCLFYGPELDKRKQKKSNKPVHLKGSATVDFYSFLEDDFISISISMWLRSVLCEDSGYGHDYGEGPNDDFSWCNYHNISRRYDHNSADYYGGGSWYDDYHFDDYDDDNNNNHDYYDNK